MNHCQEDNKRKQEKKQDNPAEDKRQYVLAGVFQPTDSQSERCRDSNQNRQAHYHAEKKQHLPAEVLPSDPLSSSPAPPDLAPFGDDAIEQNETHHAVYIDEEYPQHQRGHDQQCDQCCIQEGIGGAQAEVQKALRASSPRGYLEIASVTAAA